MLEQIYRALQDIHRENGTRGVLIAIAIAPVVWYIVESVNREMPQKEDNGENHE